MAQAIASKRKIMVLKAPERDDFVIPLLLLL